MFTPTPVGMPPAKSSCAITTRAPPLPPPPPPRNRLGATVDMQSIRADRLGPLSSEPVRGCSSSSARSPTRGPRGGRRGGGGRHLERQRPPCRSSQRRPPPPPPPPPPPLGVVGGASRSLWRWLLLPPLRPMARGCRNGGATHSQRRISVAPPLPRPPRRVRRRRRHRECTGEGGAAAAW